ncbi:Eco57I restriction-modification methylase domain-containing protein [Corallococcus macrosporus]|uniref:site-specific DNA-methyltransferase (adenine-specific) n=1 Tax=Myxococcus fulvus (strain ATCC BAA-855 / HW-1) TaxID=483219 RepID=F8CAA1_MYXFH|nr:N-6 DNA methylase [Corallococcus macrosporus]AEI64558.1 type II DNA modification enzyme [Corallococcus macrosporus]
MAPRRKFRQREARLAFEALAIEGGLLSPDWLARVTQLTAGGQSEADYRVPKGLNLRDEIGRYWRIAQAHWADFSAGRNGGGDALALSERFVLSLLRDSLGFTSLAEVSPSTFEDRTYPVRHAALSGCVPVVVAPAGSGLETHAPLFGDGGRRRNAFGLAQEFLNAADGALWGITSDGNTLRILRDNTRLTRPAWIEADLARIFTEERYADFAALWLLAHESRFGNPGQPATDCPLETWRTAGREEGTRARDHLREGVEAALLALGQGFLSHPDNLALHEALRTGALTKDEYFQQLLRLVYRIIFLLTAEERGLLYPEGASETARKLYEDGYGMRRLRERALKRSAHDRYSDLWEATKIVFRGVDVGEPRLALPALSGIFARAQCPTLDSARIENRALLLAIFRLSWLSEQSGLSRVNWRDMGPEELGSVYESLLELVPQITDDRRTFSFATGGEAKGNARKTTGSYYTPESLVSALLDTALEPVVRNTIAANPERPAEALLQLSIVDPACGSGHFLLAAARRLANHVARLQVSGTPSVQEYRSALRQVVGRCIYGVDLNPMAVELCKVSLWMEALDPKLPLTFLNSHIQQGHALLGTAPALLAQGIPDAAWEPLEGDDRKVASALKKRNKKSTEGQRAFDTLWSPTSDSKATTLVQDIAELEATLDVDVATLTSKETKWATILDSEAYRHLRFVADAWCAAFVWPKQPGPLAEAAPTNELWRQLRDAQGQPPALTTQTVGELSSRYRFFHWHLAFPLVFKRGGFDVVLGNPPWERVKLQEMEFFASRSEDIAKAANAAARKKLIAALPFTDPVLWDEWCTASRVAEGQSHFIRQSGRYPLCGKGDVNTYAIFAEHNRSALAPRGRAGFIVPTGIATDDTTKDYFGTLVDTKQLASFLSFENEEFIFPAVHHAFKFALLTVDASGQIAQADLVFFARQVSDLADPNRHFSLSPADFATLNPNTRTCPTFRTRRDADLNLAIYRRTGVLWNENDPDGNPWGLRFLRMFDMANDSGLFRTRAELDAAGWTKQGNQYHLETATMLPLYEAKMVHHFDHRFGTYEGQSESQSNQGKLPELDDAAHADPERLTTPRYWTDRLGVEERLHERWQRDWLLGWRDICRSTDQRTVISTVVPRAAIGHTLPLAFSDRSPSLIASFYANLCSIPLDYTARQKIGGTHLTYSYLKQLPLFAPSDYEAPAPWTQKTPLHHWILPRALELLYTAQDLQPFARDCGYEGPPFRWSPERRSLLRAELDAAFFHLYGLSHADADYVLDTFPIVRKNDMKAYGEYRTKRLILGVHGALSEAIRTGTPYRSPLFQ